jgi:hypothetical protein
VADPDNGIAGSNHAPNRKKGVKHITLEEIQKLVERHPCVVLYHHFDRSASHTNQACLRAEQLKLLNPGSQVTALRYKRVSPRAYFIISQAEQYQAIQAAITALTTNPWDFHFERLV